MPRLASADSASLTMQTLTERSGFGIDSGNASDVSYFSALLTGISCAARSWRVQYRLRCQQGTLGILYRATSNEPS